MTGPATVTRTVAAIDQALRADAAARAAAGDWTQHRVVGIPNPEQQTAIEDQLR